ncbi:MAG: response regulator [Pyrinomonadaceae bacterium]|nr:response regulator [Pyrinomonadaceae bacterium]
MDNTLLQGFIEEVESYLPSIRSGILVSTQEVNGNSELKTSLTHIQTIKNAAAMIELSPIENVAGELERELKLFSVSKSPISDEQSRYLLDKLSELEEAIAQLLFSVDDFPDSIADFVDESFDTLQVGADENERSTEDSFDSFEEFEIDEEMLEIFAVEADDLLVNINANLDLLENAPNNREALLEIRRNAHTLKGSAGIVGLKKLSETAHKVEDLLDHISDNNIEGSRLIFDFLSSATDCFRSLTISETSPESSEKVQNIYKTFESIMAMLTGQSTNVEVPVIEKREVPAPVESGEPTPQVSANQTRSIVRVSLEKLDDLVKIVSGMVINRSVFEQRLSELEQQIAELSNSTRRLQTSTTKLETDFQADLLAANNSRMRTQPQITGFGNFPSRFSQTSVSDANSFDSLEFDNYTDFNQTTRELIETTADTAAINYKLDILQSNFETLFDTQRGLIDEMQEKLLRLRMVKFGSLLPRLQRTVRVTAEEEGKFAELSIEGENLEVDTQILDSLVEPLLHVIRNAIAHGVEAPETRRLVGKPESGRIVIRAVSEGTHIVVTISDDGRGISASVLKSKAVEKGFLTNEEALEMSDEDALSLIFLPGLTTAEDVNYVSGRGVGMNIVKTQIQRHQGTVLIHTEPQKGSTFTIRMPMALAVTRALLVKADKQTFAFPLRLVKHICECPTEYLNKVTRERSIQLGDTVYRVVHLSEMLGMPSIPVTNAENVPLLLIETSEKPCAMIVDQILRPEEIAVKPLGNPLKSMSELLGATILGDGSVVPVLDLMYLLTTRNLNAKKPVIQTEIEIKPQTSVMIVDDSPSVRHLTSKVIKNADWLPVVAKDGLEALEILQNSRELPCVILTDVEMPQMDGYELLASLKRNDKLKHIPVVMITSRAGEKHRMKAVELGVSEYLSKPFEDAYLVDAIKRLSA